MKRIFLLPVCFVALVNQGFTQQQKTKILPYKNFKLPVENRVKDLLSRMTLEEKVYQMCALRLSDGDEIFKTSGVYTVDNVRSKIKTHGVGNISCPTTDMDAAAAVKTANEIQRVAVEETRLGIPAIINDEALHGYKGSGATSYPQSIALSCTWNLPLMKEVAQAIGKETYSRGIKQVLSPVLDLARDPRHGRMEETYGEDPYLVSRFGVEYINAVQASGVICTPKHFVANFVGANGLDAGNVSLSERDLREIHFVPYQAAIKEAHAKSLMAAYNEIDGIACSANNWLLNTVLRKEWGFKGYTVSDWGGIGGISRYHKGAKTLGEAATMAANAGLDVDLPRLSGYVQLIGLVKAGKIKQSVIDQSVKRILTVKFEMGLFEKPYIEDTGLATKLTNDPALRQLALRAARESVALLKNKDNVLPLAKNVKNIAVIGPNANMLQLGGYSAKKVTGVTPLQGIKNLFGAATTIRFAKGCNLTGFDRSGFAQAIDIARQSDICVLVMGGQYGTTGGETQDRIDLNLMGAQEDLIKEISALGKKVIVVLDDGRPVTMMNWIDKVDGVLLMFPAGEEGGTALAEILAGKVNPSGKITVTIPRHTGQVPMCLLTRPYGREGSIAEYPEITTNKFTQINRYYPLFPFGFGLSYTTFKYTNVHLVKDTVTRNEKIRVSVDVTNTGKLDGDEIVQLYFSNLNPGAVSQPRQQLRGFQRVTIPASSTKTVTFILSADDLAYLDENLKSVIEPGDFELFVGTNCLEGLKARFTLKAAQ